MTGRILALDVGTKRMGVSVSDGLGLIAQGLPTIHVKSRKDVLSQILGLAGEYEAAEIVVGLPRNMDGSLGFKSQEVMQFADELHEIVNIPVVLWDERLTTQMAERAMLEGDLSRKKRKRRIDTIAAQLILQSYLDSKRKAET